MYRKGKKHSNSSFKKPYFKSGRLSAHRLKALKKDTNKTMRRLNSDFEVPTGKVYKLLVKSCWYIRHAASIHEYFGGDLIKK